MDIFNLLNMIGGLSLFLYGMNIMGNGLSKMAGGKLETILEKLTTKRIFAVLLGAGVTAVIQSSSATTVMVVGFVNSGIMKLSQAVGIIMGANIGTTITSWMLSLTGIEGSTIWLKLLKPSSFSPILAAIGIVIVMVSKGESKKKDIGSILLGFAILMFGMETMSSAVSGLADNPSFTKMMTAFSNPILGMVVGAILTAIIQSSSASVGILQALCATGAVQYSVALPIIMGQNIGTCVTSIISSRLTLRVPRRRRTSFQQRRGRGTIPPPVRSGRLSTSSGTATRSRTHRGPGTYVESSRRFSRLSRRHAVTSPSSMWATTYTIVICGDTLTITVCGSRAASGPPGSNGRTGVG